jgi:hypothetical protein
MKNLLLIMIIIVLVLGLAKVRLIITAQRNSSEGNKEKQELHLLRCLRLLVSVLFGWQNY